MKGLLYKDLYLARKGIITGMLIIAGIVLFAVIFILGMNIGNFQSIKELGDIYNLFFKGCILLICLGGINIALNSASVMGMDEKAEWYKVLYSAPVSPLEEVMSRYILAFIVNTLISIWSALILPVIYLAGDKPYGLEEMKTIIYCWLIGFLVIMIRLPLDIIFPSKVSTGIVSGILGACILGLIVWLALEDDTEKIVATMAGWIKFVYNHAVIFVVGVVTISFAISYFGKKKRRWV